MSIRSSIAWIVGGAVTLGLLASPTVFVNAQNTGWPDATNTGYRNAPDYPGSLAAWTGGAIQSNRTYNFIDFGSMSIGSVSSPVSNVTFHGCRFKSIEVNGALVTLYGDNITFDYSSFEPGVAAPPTPFNQSYQYGLGGQRLV